MKRLFAYLISAALLLAAPATASASFCFVFNGCTGTSTAPAYGQLLIGGKNGEFEYVASSTVGGVNSIFGRKGAVTAQAGDYSTSLVTEGSNLYFTGGRVDAQIEASSSIPRGSSAAYGKIFVSNGVAWTAVSTSTLGISALDLTGVLPVSKGGLNLSSAPAYGQIPVGTVSGGYSLTATSSLGLPTFAGANSWTGTNAFATSTVGSLNGVTSVTGWPYAQTGTGINIALSVCSSSGGQVYLPPANYPASADINIPSNCSLAGEGRPSAIVLASGANIVFSGVSNSGISNLYVDTSGLAAFSKAVHVLNSSHIKIDRLITSKSGGFAVFDEATGTGASDDVTVSNSTLYGNGNNDVIGGGPATTTASVTNFAWRDNYVVQDVTTNVNDANALDLVGVSGVSIKGGSAVGNIEMGFESYPTKDANVIGVSVSPALGTTTARIGILVASTSLVAYSNININSNTIEKGSVYAYDSPGSAGLKNVNIDSNAIDGGGGTQCIFALGIAGGSVVGNSLANCYYGIYESGSTGVNFSLNSISSTTVPISGIGGSNNSYFANINNGTALTLPDSIIDNDYSTSIIGGLKVTDGTDIAKFVIATSTFNVGIQTASPRGMLDVGGTNTFGTLYVGSSALGGSIFVANSSNGMTASGGYFFIDANQANGFQMRTSGSPRLSISQSGLVGIGSTTPFAQLSLAGGAGSAAPLFAISSSTSAFATSSVLQIDPNGLFGIATSAPGSLLSLGKIANFTAATTTFYGTGGISLAAGCFAIGGNCLTLGSFSGTVGIASGGTATTTMYSGGVLFYDGTLNAISQAGDGMGLFYDRTNKRLGIGTNGPSVPLTVNGASYVVGSSADIGSTNYLSAGLRIAGSASKFNGVTFQGQVTSDMYFGRTSAADDLVISRANQATNELVRFTNGGKVGIGSSSPSAIFQATNSSANATTTVELGKSGQTKGTCLKMYDAVGTAEYLSIVGGSLQVSATACASVTGF